MRFDVYGSYELERTRNGLIASTAEDRREYWEWVDGDMPGLPEACGCYIFAIQASRGTLPWYIGKAERQSFVKECFSPHKVNHFNNAIVGRKGKPVLFFLPQLTRRGKFRKPTTSVRKGITELESLLIGMAISRNPSILNTRGTRMLKKLTVEGFINSNRKAKGGAAGALRKVLGG